ncbi:MAG: hypothetical protein FJ008_07875 [Chloroflexi bacterium]|nr:hypothetical protein [Chloroflexota bacterium]MBM3173049.1 hypothetical protein [Chloroflexota bacterium]MBM3175734.1 hypothetical protein [Chloroflexota bacterium]MBM4450490.1 hypothetical protein [Chloroflexota bacterium]
MTIALVNLLLTLIILGVGIWVYTRKKSDVALYIGIAFGLFALTHLFTLANLAAVLSILIIILRLAAYGLVLFALYRILAK